MENTAQVDLGPTPKVERIQKEFYIALNLPGSKSMTLRHFLLAGLADGPSIIRSWGFWDDTKRMLEAPTHWLPPHTGTPYVIEFASTLQRKNVNQRYFERPSDIANSPCF